MIRLAALWFALVAGATESRACEDVLAGRAPRAWVTSVLDPARSPSSVHSELASLNALVPASPIARDPVVRAIERAVDVADLDRINRVDDRWWIHRSARHAPRLFTGDLKYEVRAPQAATELARRLSRPSTTRVTNATILTDVSLHRVSAGPVELRRVNVDGCEHVAGPAVHVGFAAFAPAVRALLRDLGARSVCDEANARASTEIPRVARWSKPLRSRGTDFARMHFREICLDPPCNPNLEARNHVAADPVGRYALALANDDVPLIVERWEVDEMLRHALASLLLPDSVRDWFRKMAERTLRWSREAAKDEDHRRIREVQSLLMRHFEALRLTLATSLETGRPPSFAEFMTETAFARPVLLRRTRRRLEDATLGDLPTVLGTLGTISLPDDDDRYVALDRVETDALRALHVEICARFARLFEIRPDDGPSRRGGR